MELTKQGRPPLSLPPRASPPKAHMPESLPGKPSVHKQPPPKAHPQTLESVRSKFRDALAAALSSMDSGPGQQSPGNVGSAGENSGSRMQGITGADARKDNIDDDDDDDDDDDAAIEKKKQARIRKAQSLASKIEEELFKLFGGSKKYMEKGTSLVFNLEDRHNPALRERVFSEQISPKWLCAMTVEELAKMFPPPDIQVYERRLARKTRKGEFQVEVEEETDGAFQVQAGPGGDSLPYVPSEPIIAVQTKTDDKTSAHCRVIKELDISTVQDDGAVGTWNSNTSSDLEYLASEINDLVLKPRYDGLNKPEIVPFSDFLRIVASEPHSKHQPIGALLQDDRKSNKVDNVNSANFPKTMNTASVSEFQIYSEDVPSPRGYCESNLESLINKPASVLDPVEEPMADALPKSSPQMVDAEESHTVNGFTPECAMQCGITSYVALTHDSICKATIQHESSRTNIVAIFKSGEKPSTCEWHRFLEIERPVRLGALNFFLVELPKSRSRTIMVTELRWKEGSPESGRHHLLKTIDSYTADGTGGLVKPAEGIKLYLCPSQGKAAQILADHLPKEHLGSLTVTGTSIIGVIVWRKPNGSSMAQIINSDPHSTYQPIGALVQDDCNSNKAEKVNSEDFPITMDMAAASEFQFHSHVGPSPPRGYCQCNLESPIDKPAPVLDPVEEPKGDVLAKSSHQMVDAAESRTVNGLTPESAMQCEITPDVALTHDSIWEATIQHESSRTNIIAIFKSGEKPSTREWHRFLDMKGPVRLSALKEFLIELPKSRSRTIMVTELRCKEGSLESGRHHLLKTIDSYIADETVGLVKPAHGITLYLCPSQGKAAQILADHLPKEHLHSLTMSRTSVIGVVVWQRPRASSRVPSRHDGSNRQATSSSSLPMISKPSSRSSNASHQEVPAAGVLPGVGSGIVRHQDGLPAEYNLVSVSNSAADVTRTESYESHQHPVRTSDPIEEIIRRYDTSQGNIQQERIQQLHYPYEQYHQQLQHHSMRQNHMARNSQTPLTYTQHQHTAMPVHARPLIYGHPMQPAQQSYSGVPDDDNRTHVTRAWYLW